MTDRLTIVNDLATAGLIDVDQANTLLDNPTQPFEIEFGANNQGSAVASVATGDSTDTTTVDASTLINENKAQLNALLVQLRALNIIAT